MCRGLLAPGAWPSATGSPDMIAGNAGIRGAVACDRNAGDEPSTRMTSHSNRLTVRRRGATERVRQPATIVVAEENEMDELHNTVRTAAPCRGRIG